MELTISVDDFGYEEEILRDKTLVKGWLRYLEHKKTSPALSRFIVYERALSSIPGSYKLWKRYMDERVEYLEGLNVAVTHNEYVAVARVFERCMGYMHKMPRLWMDYIQFMETTKKITDTRHCYDAALRALPVTQHHKVWPHYLTFVCQYSTIRMTICQVYRRYMKVNRSDTIEDYADYLLSIGRYHEGILLLVDMTNDESFQSKRKNKTKAHQWMELCKLLSNHGHCLSHGYQEINQDHNHKVSDLEQISGRGLVYSGNAIYYTSLSSDSIIRSGIGKYPDVAGHLWCLLADYYTNQGSFQKAMAIYEEAMRAISTFSNFTLIYDAFMSFFETLITQYIEILSQNDKPLPTVLRQKKLSQVELDLLLKKFEYLIERRPMLVNSVLLRQNPHNVSEWLKRAELMDAKPEQKILVFADAISTIDPIKATGNVSDLWIAFANFYYGHGQVTEARMIYENGVKGKYTSTADLAAVWCAYAEMEIDHEPKCNCTSDPDILADKKCHKRPLAAIKRAASWHPGDPSKNLHLNHHPTNHVDSKIMSNSFQKYYAVQCKLHRSLKIWSLYVDLEEHYGSFESTKLVYERLMDLKIATVQMFLNYADLLWEKQYFEEAFKIYERGISSFPWPLAHELWTVYLTKFVARYAGSKIERTRDLFEQALSACSPEFAKPYFYAYADFEERLANNCNRALLVYDRATKTLTNDELYECFLVYLKKTAHSHGIPKTRQIYDTAIDILPNRLIGPMCLHYITMELSLGEVARVRQLYNYASQFYDPRIYAASFWAQWSDFEVQLGNQDTYREHLKRKRAVLTDYTSRISAGAHEITKL